MNTSTSDSPITIERNPNRVIVKFNGRTIADSRSALTLHEATLPPVFYIPRSDVDMSLLERTTRSSHCPHKGDAAYYTIRVEGRSADNAVWSYENPYPDVAAIKEHVAFYPNRVDAIEEREDTVRRV